MSLLTPIGLLGLLSLGVLLLIYLLKPNYQNKYISSTFVWKLSLRYKKKRIPISKLRSILLLICQILILTICAFCLTRPFIPDETVVEKNEKVLIIDASASMHAVYDGETRFERAVREAKEYTRQTLNNGGVVTVILADNDPYVVFQQFRSDKITEAYEKLDELVLPDSDYCSYGLADLDKAVELADAVVKENSMTEVVLYTAKSYLNKGSVKIHDVSEEGEWNAAILDAKAEIVDNFFVFEVDVASYGNDVDLDVICAVNDINGNKNDNIEIPMTVRCMQDKTVTVTFNTRNSGHDVYSFSGAHIYLSNVMDNLDVDNDFWIYGGSKPIIKIQYASSASNNFFNGALLALKTTLRNKWDIQITEVREDRDVMATSGYDIYVFEHRMPENVPSDGVVILSDLDKVPNGVMFDIASSTYVPSNTPLMPGDTHDITRGVNAENILVSSYREVLPIGDANYTTLMYCAGKPIVLAKNEPGERVVVMSFSLNLSSVAVLLEFPLLIKNVFNYYFPATIEQYSFAVNDRATVNARGNELVVTRPHIEKTEVYKEFPITLDLETYGTYSLKQTTYAGLEQEENFFVHIDASESDFVTVREKLPDIFVEETRKSEDFDLLLYFAIALVALLFAEWLLQIREYF